MGRIASLPMLILQYQMLLCYNLNITGRVNFTRTVSPRWRLWSFRLSWVVA